jgi:hypothetical protein
MKVSYPIKGVVSVWVGDFDSEEDFDKCTDVSIAKALGLKVPLATICEVAFENTPIAIRKLIEGFSGWETFMGEVEQAARLRDVKTANAVLVCYNVKCEEAPNIWDGMYFLGSFQGQDVH